MTLENSTSKTLRYAVYLSMAVIITGLALHFVNVTDNVLWFGILLLIISPLIGVLVSTISLYLDKDMKWTYVAVVLIVISAIGMLIHR